VGTVVRGVYLARRSSNTGESLLNAGRAKEAAPILRQAYAADPLIPGALVDLSFALFVQDPHSVEAQTLINEAVALNPERLASRMIRLILSLGRNDLDLAIEHQREINKQASCAVSGKFGEGLMAMAHDPVAPKNHLHSAAKQSASLELDSILLYPWAIAIGDDAFATDDVVLRTPAKINAHEWFWVTYLAPQFSPIRKDPRVKEFLKQTKYVDHWRARLAGQLPSFEPGRFRVLVTTQFRHGAWFGTPIIFCNVCDGGRPTPNRSVVGKHKPETDAVPRSWSATT
jgi:hypothetical protein